MITWSKRRAETRFSSRWGGDWTACSFYNKATRARDAWRW